MGMLPGKDGNFAGNPGAVRSQGDKFRAFEDQPILQGPLPFDQGAREARPLLFMVCGGAIQNGLNHIGDERKGEHLGVWMFKRCAGEVALVAENLDILDALVLVEGADTGAIGAQDVGEF
jgi:hypothetical protein